MDAFEGRSSAEGTLVMVIGAEGGSLRLVATGGAVPAFAAFVNDQCLLFIDEGPAISPHSAWGTWEASIKALDRYPWRHLSPIAVDPAYADRVWDLVSAAWEGLSDCRQEEWAALCGKSSPNQTGRYAGGPVKTTANITGTLIRAVSFAAHKHRNQRRKDADASPYINHPIALADVLANEGGIDAVAVLCAAVLHDTIEDTDTTAEELEVAFGSAVSSIVLEVTDDKSLSKDVRKQRQIEHAPHISSEAKR